MTPRQCFYVPAEQFHPVHGFVPSLVTEDEPGHAPLVGQGEFSEPWYWGTDLQSARSVCDKANAQTFGLTVAEAEEIVASSITASIRADGAQARLNEKLGRHYPMKLIPTECPTCGGDGELTGRGVHDEPCPDCH